jgi:hypothetical protein
MIMNERSNMEEASLPAVQPGGQDRTTTALRNRRFNERVKLAVSALDRLSTIILAGGILAPVFQHQNLTITSAIAWFFGAGMLHITGRFGLSLIREEK